MLYWEKPFRSVKNKEMHIYQILKLLKFLSLILCFGLRRENVFTGTFRKILSGSRRFFLLIWGYESICEIIQKRALEMDIYIICIIFPI